MNLFVTKRNGHKEPIDLDRIHRVLDWAAEMLDERSSSTVFSISGITTSSRSETILSAISQVKFLRIWSLNCNFLEVEGKLYHDTIHDSPFLFGLAKLLKVSCWQARPP